jgi:uncharacterized protein DUF6886
MPLYHFSEDPTIERFVPRPPLAHPEWEALVWAIDAWHQPIYWVPRDCPRVCFWPLPATTPEDRAHYEASTAARMVVTIEAAWLERLRTTTVYRYTMPEEPFESLHDHGAHVSRETVVPLAVEPMDDLLARLAAADVELRITPSLVPLVHSLQRTSLHWSLIRMRNAQGWESESVSSRATPKIPVIGRRG